MDMDFTGKTVIITGAAKGSPGIGYATALLFAENHANLVAVDIDEAKLASLEKDLAAGGEKVMSRVCDVGDEARVNEVVQEAICNFGKVDILVNNAGIYKEDRTSFADSKSGAWKKKIDVNILGTMYFTHAVINNMIENQYGRIINIASVAGVYGLRNMVDYSMTKGAVIAFTKALSKETGPFGITVNAVSPGDITDTRRVSDMSFLGRSGTPQECASLICFLASDDAGYISGQNYQIDGSRRTM